MKTIKQDVMSEKIEVKKSQFLSFIYKLKTEDDALVFLDFLRNEFSDATHICYAYKVANIERCSDAGEPSGTAGKPILNVIKQKDLSNVLVAVIRFFGGIKLGAGGLCRAYTEATTKVLELVDIVEVKEMCHVKFHIDFDKAFNIYVLTNLGIFSILERVGNDFTLICSPENLDETLNAIKRYGVSNIKVDKVKV